MSGRQIDHLTDIYSLGVVTFQLLTGQLPFVAESFMQVMFKHVSGIAPKPSEQPAGVSPELDGPVLAMLAKVPAERPASAGEAIENLAQAASRAGFSIEAKSSGVHAPVTGRTPASLLARGPAEAEATTLSASETTTAPQPAPGGRRPLLVGAGVVVLAVLGFGAWRMSGSTAAPAAPAPEPSASAPVAAAPTPPPAPVVSAAPAKTSVVVQLQSVPERVDVYLGDDKLGTVPDDRIELPRSEQVVKLRVEADGYKPSTVSVKPSSDAVVSVKLARKPHVVAPRPPKAPKSELEF